MHALHPHTLNFTTKWTDSWWYYMSFVH